MLLLSGRAEQLAWKCVDGGEVIQQALIESVRNTCFYRRRRNRSLNTFFTDPINAPVAVEEWARAGARIVKRLHLCAHIEDLHKYFDEETSKTQPSLTP